MFLWNFVVDLRHNFIAPVNCGLIERWNHHKGFSPNYTFYLLGVRGKKNKSVLLNRAVESCCFYATGGSAVKFLSCNHFIILHKAVLPASYKKMLMEWRLCSQISCRIIVL